MAANATFALKPGVWFLRVRFVIFAPDSRREPSPPSGRKSTQPTVQILEASSELMERLDQFHNFTEGQIVKWKRGLKNRRFPDYGEPAIVTAVLPSAMCDPSEVAAG